MCTDIVPVVPQALIEPDGRALCPQCKKPLTYFDTVHDTVSKITVRHYHSAGGNCTCSPVGYHLPVPTAPYINNTPASLL